MSSQPTGKNRKVGGKWCLKSTYLKTPCSSRSKMCIQCCFTWDKTYCMMCLVCGK